MITKKILCKEPAKCFSPCMCITTYSQRLQDFAIQTSFQWMEWESKGQELQRFLCKNILLRRYGSYKGLSHLELLMSAVKLHKKIN